MESKREIRIDDIKCVACILVVLGHFFQSMYKSNIISDTVLYKWFIDTIYLFHVPLFFICSGYLYQKHSSVRSVKTWLGNLWKKLIVLGVPYFVFLITTWSLKKVFESSVNSSVGGLFHSLFEQPIAPYWYLFVLFFLFAVTVTIQKKHEMIVLFAIALALKILIAMGVHTDIYIIDKIMSEWIWFVLGMSMAYCQIKTEKIGIGIIAGLSFIAVSVFYELFIEQIGILDFIIGILACYSIISIVSGIDQKRSEPIFKRFGKYTMPVFLMHTLFAAPLRSVLFKLGISSAVVHIVLGILISFLGPVIAMMILDKLKPLDFIVYPGRYLKKRK